MKKTEVFEEIDRNSGYLKEVSLFLHGHPEIGFEEYESSKYLAAQLEKLGFQVNLSVYGVKTAFRATMDTSRPGPTICILAEYDALPMIVEGKGKIIVHACGHNLNSAAAIGAAIGVKKVIGELRGRMIIQGTPAEEGGGGKIVLLNGGAFTDVDVVISLHGDQRDWFTVARSCTASKFFNLTFTGKRSTTKGATIDSSNPLDALGLFLSVLSMLDNHLTPDTLIQRRLSPIPPTAINVLPLTSSIDTQVRSGDEDYLERVVKRVKDAAEGIASATGSTVTIVENAPSYQRIIQNETLEKIAKKNIEETGHKFTQDSPSKYPFGTDAGNISHVVPLAQFLIGRPEGFNFHTKEAVEQSVSVSAQRMMIEGAKIMAGTAIDLMASPDKVQSANDELKKYQANNFKGTVTWHTE